jgi:hypothetical protein
MSSESEMPTMSAERGAARRALRLTKLEHKLLRSNILPIAFGFPFGLSIVVPVNMPAAHQDRHRCSSRSTSPPNSVTIPTSRRSTRTCAR